MDEHAIRKILEGGGGFGGALARTVLWLPGKCYGFAMRLRRALYSAGYFSSTKASVPVISVGNITAGGSGKTPLVILLARELAARGYRPGILLRGYRQTAEGISDEAVLYSRACPGAIIVPGSNRLSSAAKAVADGATVLLMDDGFQHLRLRRDMDVVLVDATSPWGGGNTIPGGLLREPVSALAQADAIIITRSDQAPKAIPQIKDVLASRAPSAPVFTARHAPVRLQTLSGENIPLSRLAHTPVVALAGIARPEAFAKTLEQLGARVVATLSSRDHDDFTPEVVNNALTMAKNADGIVITTEKDRAKTYLCELADNNADNYNVWILGVDQDVDDAKDLLQLIVQRILQISEKG